jgi:serine/threonine protein kinase
MTEKFDALLKKLATADDSTIHALLVDATVVRPDAMEQLEEDVKTVCRAGQMPEATAIRLVTKMREVASATVMRPAATQVLQQRSDVLEGGTEVLAPRTELLAGKTELLAAKTELLAGKTELLAAKTELLGPRPELPGAKTELLGAKTEMLGPKPEMPGAKTEMLAAETELSRSTAEVQAAKTVMSKTVQDAPLARTEQIPTAVQRRRASDAGIKRRSSESLGPGSILKDRYILKREIGRGGMGTVYAAEDRLKLELGNPEPMVAVKVLQARLAVHEAALMALEREATKAQALAHPNVGTVFGFDRDDDVVFVTMELLTGSPLDEVIRNSNGQGIGRARSMKILAGIAQGLAYAHAKGLVHADLKPSNIFLTEDDIPKILDLGIARAVPGANTKKDSFDVAKLGAYTAAYATAEMIEGSDPNKADDIYALGLIAYEMLTSKHPYQRLSAPDAQKKSLKPAPIKGLSRREWALIRSSVAFTRAERPADAAVFLRQLGGISRLQQGLIAATLVLVLVAAYFGYARYQAAGPDPFDPSRPQDQIDFVENMKEGDASWEFYTKGVDDAWTDALRRYATAYKLHPRDREASAALRRLAKQVLAAYPESQTTLALQMVEESPEYLATYGPVKKALGGLKSKEPAAP